METLMKPHGEDHVEKNQYASIPPPVVRVSRLGSSLLILEKSSDDCGLRQHLILASWVIWNQNHLPEPLRNSLSAAVMRGDK